MRVFSLIDYLAAVDAGATAPRRALLRQLGQVAAAALPLGLLGAVPAVASTLASADQLQLLLRLEYTQQALYMQALATPGLPLSGSLPQDVQRLLSQQQQHIDFISQALRNSGIVPPTSATSYDFTGSRTGSVLFPNALTTEEGFLELAQQLEDAGVRIYLGQMALLASDRGLLGGLQRLTSVESRHAAHVRLLRRRRGVVVRPWPSNTDVALTYPITFTSTATTPAATATVYTGEANERQFLANNAQVPFGTLLGTNYVIQSAAISEAFDEPLNTSDATALLTIFAD